MNEHAFARFGQNVEGVAHGILTTFSALGKAQGHAEGLLGVERESLRFCRVEPACGKDEDKAVHQRRRGHGAGRMPPQGRAPVGQKLLGLAARGLRHAAALTGGENDAPAFVFHVDLSGEGTAFTLPEKRATGRCGAFRQKEGEGTFAPSP